MLDQGASSARNFVLIFLLARDASPPEFGLLMIGYAIFTLGVSVARHLFGAVLGIDLPNASNSAGAQLVSRSIAANLVFGVPIGIAVGAYGVVMPGLGVGKYALIMLAFSLPIILTQSLQRFWAVAVGEPARAAIVDLSWFAVAVAAFVISGFVDGEAAVLWGVGVWISGGAMGCFLFRGMGYWVTPQFGGTMRWFASDRRRFQLGSDALLSSASPLITSTVIATVAGASVVAAIRGAGTLFGPFNLLIATFALALVPEAIRLGPVRSRQLFVQVAIMFAALALLWGVILHFTPHGVGMSLLGRSWLVVQPIALITAVDYAGRGVWVSARAQLRAQDRLGTALYLRLGFTIVIIVAPILAAIVWDSATAVAMSLAGSSLIFAVVGWSVSQNKKALRG